MWYQGALIRSICGYNMTNFLNFQKKKKKEKFKSSEYLFLFKGCWSMLIKRLSIKVTFKSLLSLACMKKPNEWLQNKWGFYMAESLFFPTVFSYFD